MSHHADRVFEPMRRDNFAPCPPTPTPGWRGIVKAKKSEGAGQSLFATCFISFRAFRTFIYITTLLFAQLLRFSIAIKACSCWVKRFDSDSHF